MQQDLFGSAQNQRLDMQDAEVRYFPQFLPTAEADRCFAKLQQELAWKQDHIKLYGKRVQIPRLQAWYGEPEAQYAYSGLEMVPLPWTATLQAIRKQVEQACESPFNAVLANWYRTGQDSMGWHADNEPELGSRPVIASVTLGEARDFDFRHQTSGHKVRLALEHGSLLIMAGQTQLHWQHALPKRTRAMGSRINLTFRFIHALEKSVIRP